jgi:hypothetical protein
VDGRGRAVESDPEGTGLHRGGDVYAEAYAARASSMADRGFTALKFDLDLPLCR